MKNAKKRSRKDFRKDIHTPQGVVVVVMDRRYLGLICISENYFESRCNVTHFFVIGKGYVFVFEIIASKFINILIADNLFLSDCCL